MEVFDKYGEDNCKIELVESCPCDSQEVEKRRLSLYNQNECVNRCLLGRTRKDYSAMYRSENPET